MIYIHGIGHYHPENIIDNHFLQELDIGTTSDWILERVGIHSRRTVLPLDYIRATKNLSPQQAQEASLYSNAQTAAKAAKMALQRAGLDKKDIGMVISGSCTPQHSCPAEACSIAGELEIEAPSFDINSACSSLAAQIHSIAMMRSEMLPDYILLLQPENNTRSIDYSDRNSAVLWGDCSTALIISTKVPSQWKINYSCLYSSPQGWDKVTFPNYGHFRQEGRTVQTFAIKRSVALIREMREKLSGEKALVTKFIGHQANLMMLASVCNMTEIDHSNHYFNVDQFGNCGAAGAASVLSQHWDSLVSDTPIILAVVGAGLTWGGILIEKQDRI